MANLTGNRIRARMKAMGLGWIPIGAFLILALIVSEVNPLFESTDELRHYRYVRLLVTERRLPVQGAAEARMQGHHPPLFYATGALLTGWIPSEHDASFTQPTNPFWGYRNWEVGVDNKLQYRHSPAEDFPYRDGYTAAIAVRWVNVLIGTATVALTYLWARRFWPRASGMALAVASLVAFNPQFIYLSAAINNDILAALMGTAVLVLCTELVREGASWRLAAILGVIYGLALLTKLHLAALGAVIVVARALALRAERRERVRRALVPLVRDLALIFGAAGVVAGWWFVRNWRLYGDPTGMAQLNAMWGGRSAQGHLWALIQGVPYLWSSFWGRFGYGQIPLPKIATDWLLVFFVLGLIGWLRSLWVSVLHRYVQNPSTTKKLRVPVLSRAGFALLGDGFDEMPPSELGQTAAVYGLLALAVALFLGVVGYYILIQPAGAMGRFLFPVLPAMAVLLVGGLQALNRRYATWLGPAVAVAMGVFAVYAIGGVLWPAVRYPPPVPVPESPALEADVGSVARVLDVSVEPTLVRPGDPVFVRVVWEPVQPTAEPLTVFVHLVDDTGVVLAQRDTWPGLGRATTTYWMPGRVFEDVYRIDVPETVYRPNHATIRLGLGGPTVGRLPITVRGSAEPAGSTFETGRVDILADEAGLPNPLDVNFGNEIALVGYALEPRVLIPGETTDLTLYWEVIGALDADYQVFAQVWDAEYNVWGSRDGGNPGWTAGEVVSETRAITLIPETPPGTYPIQVGLFDGGERLPRIAPDGRPLEDRMPLGPIQVLPSE
jgi:4-amino-4-deoxy-L-arabinose transferase-like glycosyltransferase